MEREVTVAVILTAKVDSNAPHTGPAPCTSETVKPLVVDSAARSGTALGARGHRFKSGHPDQVDNAIADLGNRPACAAAGFAPTRGLVPVDTSARDGYQPTAGVRHARVTVSTKASGWSRWTRWTRWAAPLIVTVSTDLSRDTDRSCSLRIHGGLAAEDPGHGRGDAAQRAGGQVLVHDAERMRIPLGEHRARVREQPGTNRFGRLVIAVAPGPEGRPEPEELLGRALALSAQLPDLEP